MIHLLVMVAPNTMTIPRTQTSLVFLGMHTNTSSKCLCLSTIVYAWMLYPPDLK